MAPGGLSVLSKFTRFDELLTAPSSAVPVLTALAKVSFAAAPSEGTSGRANLFRRHSTEVGSLSGSRSRDHTGAKAI